MAVQTHRSLVRNYLHQKSHTPKLSSAMPFSISLPISSLLTQNQLNLRSVNLNDRQTTQFVSVFQSKRRLMALSTLGLLVNGFLPNFTKSLLAQELVLQRYTDSKEGFTLLVPSSYIKVDKGGATVLFEELNNGSNNVGVVVNPVRITSLAEFGSPQFVAEKLIQAEKRKESTKDAEVIGVAERSGHGGLQIYEFEYKVDSTRGGMKRIFSAAFVAAKKLYLLNIAHSDKLESPLDTPTRMILEEVLHSFDSTQMA